MTDPLDPAWLSRKSPPRGGAAEVGLLVSVRSAAEWRRVVGLPVTVLDLKEPRRGALAAASPELWHQAAREVPPHHRLSAALGEWDEADSLAPLVPERFAFAKAGPAQVPSVADLRGSWQDLGERLAPGIELVAVAYADFSRAGCPQPEEIFQAAAQAGLRTWLVDTYDKTGGDSIGQLGRERLQRIATLAQRHGARWVLAGSLRQAAAGELLAQGLWPTLFGVRGDVCAGDRTQRLSPSRVSDWLQLLKNVSAGKLRCRTAEGDVSRSEQLLENDSVGKLRCRAAEGDVSRSEQPLENDSAGKLRCRTAEGDVSRSEQPLKNISVDAARVAPQE